MIVTEIIEAIFEHRAYWQCIDRYIPTPFLLMSHESFHELKKTSEFAEQAKMQKPGDFQPKFFDVEILMSPDVEEWKLVTLTADSKRGFLLNLK